MQKRAIIAILLTFAVIVLWSLIQAQFFPQAPSKPQPQEVRKEEASPQEKVSEKKTEIRESKPLKEVKTPAKAKGCSTQGGLHRDPELLGGLHVRRCETEAF